MKKKNKQKNKVDPNRIIQAIEENFNDILSKPNLKNLALTSIAIAKAKKMTINEIARCLPTDTKRQKSKQTRLLRFLDNQLPLDDMMFCWSRFVLRKVYGKRHKTIIILVDGVSLIYGYKAFVAAIPFRKRAIPIVFKVYTNQQISDMSYLSENHIIWNFLDIVVDFIKEIMPDRKAIFVFDRGFADEKLMKYMEFTVGDYIIRVPKNCGIICVEYKGKLLGFERCGYFKDVFYHLREKIKVNLYSGKNPSDADDPFFVVSNIDDSLRLLYSKRMQIEEGFRDLKSLFGFKELVLKDIEQTRFELLFLLVIMSMGMILILYEKSGYRWSRYYNTFGRKEYSLIRVIKEKLRDSWINLRLDAFFTLDYVCFYEV